VRSVFLLICFFVLFTGCFDLVEDVTFHPDGSGTFLFEANLSQSKTKLKTIQLLDSVDGMKVPTVQQINKDLNKARDILLSADGIVNLTEKRNMEDYIFSVHFDFRNIACLNSALSKLYKAFNPAKAKVPDDPFQYDLKTFVRRNEYQGKQEMKKLPDKEVALLENATFTGIYRFDNSVLTFSNTDSKLSKNGKAVLLKLHVNDLIKGTKSIANTIKLQP
jgi:hypothetical protein